MKKRRLIIPLVLLVLVLAAAIYNVYDNGRVAVARQDIALDGLPESFEGYRILQISDLHGRFFGDGQSKLLAAIAGLDYDCVLFTGDMNRYAQSDVRSSAAVLTLLDGIGRDRPMYWVDGNTGPFAAETAPTGSRTGELTTIGRELEARGVRVLLEPVSTQRDGARIWLVPPLDAPEIEMDYLDVPPDRFDSAAQCEQVTAYGRRLLAWYERLHDNGEVKIRVDHYPMQTDLSAEQLDALGYMDYSLSIAGHYHGGQFRLPFYGALYIPSPTAGICGGWFPGQREVKGLNRVGDMQQYVSAGLGASARIPPLAFRLFDTPQIDLLTLHCEKAAP